jgi:hypothetical protein
MINDYVDVVWVKEVSGSGIFEAPAWSVHDGDIVTVDVPGVCGGLRERHVKDYITVSKSSDVYGFLEAINGGPIDKVKCLYHKCEVAE